MLKYCETQESLHKSLKATRVFPELLYIHFSIDAKLKKIFPEAEFHIAIYENLRGEKLWIVVRESLETRYISSQEKKVYHSFCGSKWRKIIKKGSITEGQNFFVFTTFSSNKKIDLQ